MTRSRPRERRGLGSLSLHSLPWGLAAVMTSGMTTGAVRRR